MKHMKSWLTSDHSRWISLGISFSHFILSVAENSWDPDNLLLTSLFSSVFTTRGRVHVFLMFHQIFFFRIIWSSLDLDVAVQTATPTYQQMKISTVVLRLCSCNGTWNFADLASSLAYHEHTMISHCSIEPFCSPLHTSAQLWHISELSRMLT